MKTFWKMGTVAMGLMTGLVAGVALGAMGNAPAPREEALQPQTVCCSSCLPDYNACKSSCHLRDTDCRALCFDLYSDCQGYCSSSC